MQLFDYIFNVGGNYTATINGMTEATGDFSAKVESANNWVGKLSSTLAVVDLARNAFEQIDSAVKTFNASGITLDSQMHDLSAVAGVVGEDLKKIEGYARESAKAFGTDAGVAVEGYKLLLGQLTPELAKCPEALKAMGESVQVTSKLMGNDGVAAAEVLTIAMNQYGVSLDDPMEASRKMAEMMNVMAAAGQEVSAELPAISCELLSDLLPLNYRSQHRSFCNELDKGCELLSDLLPLNYRSQRIVTTTAYLSSCELLSDLLPLNYRSQQRMQNRLSYASCELLSDLLPLNYRSQHSRLRPTVQ